MRKYGILFIVFILKKFEIRRKIPTMLDKIIRHPILLDPTQKWSLFMYVPFNQNSTTGVISTCSTQGKRFKNRI